MKKYFNTVPGHVTRRLDRRLMVGLFFILFIILIVVITLAVWFLRQQQNNSTQPTSRGETTTNNPFKTFKTDYFQFKTDKTWQFISKESTKNFFVYRSHARGLVLRDMTVYVNTLPPNLLLTRILSADVGKNRFKIRKISGHCRNALPANYLQTTHNPTGVTIDGVSFTCQVDNNQTNIGTGIKDNGLSAGLIRQNGAKAGYFLLYHDLEFTPKPSIFKDIVESFRSR